MADDQDNRYKYYLYDLGILLKKYALEAKAEKSAAQDKESLDYATGYLMGLFLVISVMQQQAETFDIPLQDLQLHDIDADRDLI